MNKVILMGRLTRDVELRQTPNGISVASFSIAVNRRFAKEGQQQADFINCVAWRQQAEFIARYFGKGRMIAVVGSLQTRSWDDQEGKKHYATEVVVEEAHFTGSRAEQGGAQTGYNNGGFGGYQNNNTFQQAPAAPSAPVQDPFAGGFDDGGFMDIDGSEDDLPF